MLVNTSELVILTGPNGQPAPAKLRVADLRTLFSRIDAGDSRTKIAKDFGINRGTLYSYLRRRSEIEAQL